MSGRCPDRLRPVGGVSAVWRSAFDVEHAGSRWTVDVDYLDIGERIGLYRDGRLVEERASPASFALPDGDRVDVALSLLGVRRVHLVTAEGERLLRPLPGTGEAWRADLARRHHRAAALVNAASWVVLVVGLLAQVPGWLDRFDWVLGAGLPSLPVLDVPGPLGVVLGIAACAAALDRALAMRHNRWLDD